MSYLYLACADRINPEQKVYQHIKIKTTIQALKRKKWVTQPIENPLVVEAKVVDLAVKPDQEGDTRETEVLLTTIAVQRKNNQLA